MIELYENSTVLQYGKCIVELFENSIVNVYIVEELIENSIIFQYSKCIVDRVI